MKLPIDVVVPAYNAAPYLRESLGSIAAQTFAPSHVIVVDDGSADETADLARSLGATVILQANRGVAEARNAGIRASRAPFVALLDADDRWHPERLEAQWRVREMRPDVAIFATDYALWTGDAISGSVLSEQRHFTAVRRERISPEAYLVSSDAMLAALAVRNFVLPSSMLLDRRIFDRDEVYFRPRERSPESDETFVGEDYEWILRALRHSPVVFVDRVLVDYRQSASALSARRGRIRYGDVVLGKMIAAEPSSYVAGAAEAFARTRSQALREAAIAHARSGELELTGARLRELAAGLPRPLRTLVAAAAALLRVALVRRALQPLTRLRRPRFR